MGSLKGRVEAFEGYIERRVEEELERQVEEIFKILEARLTREEFAKVVRILAKGESEQR
jgi:hypothetical protein